MEREIKFKGKRIDNNEWVYGFLFKKLKKCTAIEFITIGKKISSEFYIQILTIQCDVDILEEHKVHSNSVREFTGYRDKKRTKEYPIGQEIYEGDTLLNHNERIKEIATYEGRKRVIKWQTIRNDMFLNDDGSYKTKAVCTGFNISEDDAPELEII